jgi:hypothetical protein
VPADGQPVTVGMVGSGERGVGGIGGEGKAGKKLDAREVSYVNGDLAIRTGAGREPPRKISIQLKDPREDVHEPSTSNLVSLFLESRVGDDIGRSRDCTSPLWTGAKVHRHCYRLFNKPVLLSFPVGRLTRHSLKWHFHISCPCERLNCLAISSSAFQIELAPRPD